MSELDNLKGSEFYNAWKKRFDKLSHLGNDAVLALPNTTFDEWIYYFKRWSELFADDYEEFKDLTDEVVQKMGEEYDKLDPLLESFKSRFELMESKIAEDGLVTKDELEEYKQKVGGDLGRFESAQTKNFSDFVAGQGQTMTAFQNVVNKAQNDGLTEMRDIVNNKISQLNNGVRGYPNAQAIKDTFPNGADGIFVAVDTGHQWYYVNNQWVDGGSYQAASNPFNGSSVQEVFSTDTLNASHIDLNNLGGEVLFTQVNSYTNDVKSKLSSLHYPKFISGARMIIYNIFRDSGYPLGAKLQVLVSQEGVYSRALSATGGTWSAWSTPFEVGARKVITDDNGFVFDPDSVFDDYRFSLSGTDGATGLPTGDNTRLTSNKFDFGAGDILNITNPNGRKWWMIFYYKDGTVSENGNRTTIQNINFSTKNSTNKLIPKEVVKARLVVAYANDAVISDKTDLLKDVTIQKVQSEDINIATASYERNTNQTVSSTIFKVPVNYKQGDTIHFSIKSSINSTDTLQIWCYSDTDSQKLMTLQTVKLDGTWYNASAVMNGSSVNFYMAAATPSNTWETLTANVYVEHNEAQAVPQTVLPTAALRFGELEASNNDENILFYSDTHTFQGNMDDITNTKTALDVVGSLLETTPFDVVLDGGDWLNNSHDKSHARSFLGYVASRTNEFPVTGINALGNHDTNYQTFVNGATVGSPDYLTRDELKGILYRKQNNTYFKTKLRNTTLYTLDTGIDWTQRTVGEYTGNMDVFMWNQLDWFANDLKATDATHSALHLHIWYNLTDGTMGKFAVEIGRVITAYNSRQSLTLNNKTYDFTQCSGRIEFVLAGHVHQDLNTKIGNVPVVMIINNGYIQAFNRLDLIKADYKNRRLHCIRYGAGNDRTFNLDTGDKI